MIGAVGTEFDAVRFVKDSRVVLYGILRDDKSSNGEENHYNQMSDQNLFAEVLRIQGDEESLEKIIAAYPNISFGYPKKENIDADTWVIVS
jgi:hypothetical protein